MSKPLSNIESKSAPAWLLNSKDHITGSKEWNSFVGELHDTIQQQLTESHVRQFTDLSESEKELFMDRATKALQGGTSYTMLYNGISNVLDHQLNGEVARQLLEEFPVNTKSDMIIEAAKDGAISILRKWPDFKYKLHACLNQPLPNKLREIAWKLYLDNPKVRKQYVDLLANNPRAAISSKDFEISQRCEQILSSEPTFHHVRGSIGVFYAKKAVLSYHHAIKQSDVNLDDTDYMLAVPFIYVVMDRIPRREPAASRIVALLVEEYQTFMRTRQRCMLDASADEENDKEFTSYAKKVAQTLNVHDHTLARLLSELPHPDSTLPPTPASLLSAPLPRPYSGDLSIGPPLEVQSLPPTPNTQPATPRQNVTPQQNGTPRQNGTPQQNRTPQQNEAPQQNGAPQQNNEGGPPLAAYETPPPQQNHNPNRDQRGSRGADSFRDINAAGPTLPENIKELMRPIIRTLFVGFCNMEVVQYIWDQYIIGIDAPGYHHELLAAVSAVFLLLLSDKLINCNGLVAAQEVLRKEGPKLKIEHFQYLINRHFYRDLYNILNKETKSALPVIDPTQAKTEPWNQWSREIIPPRIRTDDRRNLRLQREDDRQRVLAKQREEERQKEDERERIRRERAERQKPGAAEFAAALATARQKDEEDKMYLQDMLKNEHQLRKEQEQEALDEINRLRSEVDDLKKLLRRDMAKPKPSPRPSVASFASAYSNYAPPPPPTAASTLSAQNTGDQQDLTRKGIIEFLRKISNSTNYIAHGDGQELSVLNEETKINQEKLKEDFTEAQRRVFGRAMDAKAMDSLPPEERERSMQQLMDTLNEIYVERKRREINQ